MTGENAKEHAFQKQLAAFSIHVSVRAALRLPLLLL